PVEVLSKYEVWRRVRDSEGEVGWMHVAMLSTQRTALVIGSEHAVLRDEESDGAGTVAEVEPGAVGTLKSCGRAACEVEFGNLDGWVDRSRLYGVYVNEMF